jgi:hypothetical protein
MNPISAAENHSIHSANGRWRLLYNDKPLAEGSARGFRYGLRFGSIRRLSETGILERSDILQVVLGWQQADESWHLGLILAPKLAEERGSRWCELVSWPDPEIHVFQDLAQLAGQELAQALERPFYVIPPQPLAPAAPPPDLPELPLTMGDWTLLAPAGDKRRLVIERGASWNYRKLMRIAWYGLCVLVYLLVSIATLNSNIALPNTGTLLPNPHILPYLGLGVAVFLVLLTAYHLWRFFHLPDHIVIDSREGKISAMKGEQERWHLMASEIQSVYISKTLERGGRNSQSIVQYAELNLHLGGGHFQFILQEKEGGKHLKTQPFQELRPEGIYELSRYEIETDMQAVALYIGEALGNLPVWYDLRISKPWWEF